jgi:hypothetical protein
MLTGLSEFVSLLIFISNEIFGQYKLSNEAKKKKLLWITKRLGNEKIITM